MGRIARATRAATERAGSADFGGCPAFFSDLIGDFRAGAAYGVRHKGDTLALAE